MYNENSRSVHYHKGRSVPLFVFSAASSFFNQKSKSLACFCGSTGWFTSVLVRYHKDGFSRNQAKLTSPCYETLQLNHDFSCSINEALIMLYLVSISETKYCSNCRLMTERSGSPSQLGTLRRV